MRFTQLLMALCFGALGITALSAQTPDPDADTRIDFESVDRNNDGYITRDELPADHPLTVRFEDMDSNGDERLSPDELKDMG